MPAAAEYAATNGTVVQVAPIDADTTKVWVRAPSPVAASIQGPQSVEISVTATSGPVAGSVETPPAVTGGACGAPVGPGHAAGHLLLAVLALGIVILARRR